jgi:hypothetical protein
MRFLDGSITLASKSQDGLGAGDSTQQRVTFYNAFVTKCCIFSDSSLA